LLVPADVTVRNAAAFKDRLLAAIEETLTLTLDLSQVESVDMSFFQIVCAGQRLANAMNKTLTLNQQSASESFREAVALSGLVRHGGWSLDVKSSCLWLEED
jgi:anti-anti-sigma regulatory factor